MDYSDFIAETFKSDEFQKELYNTTLEVAVNRLESQTSDVSQKNLFSYVQDLFSVNAKLQSQVIKQKQHNRSQKTLLKIFVERAENLASKDVDGSSDPYCIFAIVSSSQFTNLKSSKQSSKSTSVISSCLNPEWKETFEIPLTRDQVLKSFFQIQVWDYDGDETTEKKVKGVRGIRRYVTEKAQIVSKKGQPDQDDFMGFNSVPLTNIKADGLESWFKLRTAHTLQGVTGRLKLRLMLNTVNEPVEDKKFKNDLLYAGLLRKVVLKAYSNYYAEMKGDVEMWNGSLPHAAQVLLQEFEKQYLIPRFTAAIVRWEVYAALHVKSHPGVNISFMEKMLIDLEENSHHAQKYHKSTQFNLDMLSHSIKLFMEEENLKLANHRKVFSTKTKDYIIAIGSVLLVFKKLNTMGLYQMLRTLDPTLPSDVRMVVISAIEKGTSAYYVSLYDALLEDSLDQDVPEDQNELDQAFGGTDIRVLIKLAGVLQKDLLIGKAVYHGVFIKVLDIDYLSYVSNAIESHLASDTNSTMEKVNKIVEEKEFTTESLQNSKNSLLFRLYLAMRELAAVIKTKGPSTARTLGPDSPKRSIEKLRLSLINVDGPPSISLHNYHDWFRPTLLKWLHLSKGNTLNVITKAIEVDSAERVDNIVKHSSSAVDTIACLTGHVVTFWRSLQWPDPIDAYTIALRLTDDMASSIETYAELVYRKLKSVGFFDDEGQFDVTEELCLTLNNLQYVKEYLHELPKKMGFQAIAEAVGATSTGLTKERVTTTFTNLCSTAEIGMRNKIKSVQTGVGVKMKFEIRKYLRKFANTLSQSSESDHWRHHDANLRSQLESQADDAIRSLMDYLKSNLVTLHEWLCEPLFQRLLEVLWDVTVRSMSKVILEEFVEQKPAFFYQSRFIFDSFLRDFFYADGDGVTSDRLDSNQAEMLQSELKMRSARTRDLIKLFYMQMYEEQQQLTSKTQFGVLNVFAWYDDDFETLHVDIISADSLVPLDLNGLSDPFVQLRLAPSMMFRNQRNHQTLVEKNTLSPIWTEENFTFEVERSLMEEEGAVVIFTVLDHDILSADDLEGEAVLPLNILDGIRKQKDGESLPRHFRLPLTQPHGGGKIPNLKKQFLDENRNGLVDKERTKPSFSDVSLDDMGLTFESSLVISPLYLLRARSSFDKDADEFSRWRRKLEKAKEDI